MISESKPGSTHDAAGALRALPAEAEVGPSVRVAGRIVAWRPHGKTVFAHIADQWSRIQLYFRRDELGDEVFAFLELLDIGDVIGVAGPLFRTRTGETTVRVTEATLLAKSLRPLPSRAKSSDTPGSQIRSSDTASDTPTWRSMPRCGGASWLARA